MIYTHRINIKELIANYTSVEDQKEIVGHILLDLMTEKECKETLEGILSDILVGELEFNNKPYVVNVYKTMINILKEA